MLKKLAFTIVLIGALNAYCGTGCLKCSPDNECLYCDATQFYLLKDGRCVAAPIDNCVEMDEKGRCVECKETFYVDPVQYTCIGLPTPLQVANCAEHSGPQACNYCKTGFVLINGSCQQTSNVILNCKYQNAKNDCLKCADGYMRNATRDGCVAVPSIDNCAMFTNVQCKSCQAGYLNNPNRYIDFLFAFKTSNQVSVLNSRVADEVNKVVDNISPRTCQSTIVPNCVSFTDYQTCNDCAVGYYLTMDNKCAANPAVAIANCNMYSSASACIDCKQGYYLQSASVCAPVTSLINCLLYDTKTSFVSCKRCIVNYYLTADNICVPRTEFSQIDFCDTLYDDDESCSKCITGYDLTADKLKCLPQVEFCQKYIKSTINSLRLECSACKPGYYLNTTYKVCAKGTVNNCLNYQNGANLCAVCETNFYLVGNTCVPHVQQPLCTAYSPTQSNTCSTCRAHTFLFRPENSCVPVSSITNCSVYASKTTCSVCKDGFFLSNPSECKVIPSELYCLQLNPSLQCVKCLGNYVLDGGKCFDPQAYLIDNCASSNLNGVTSSANLRCNFCKANNIPINYASSFVCMDKKFVQRTMMSVMDRLDDKCLQYTTDQNNKLICVSCAYGLVLDKNLCVASCTDKLNATVYQQFTSVYDLNGDNVNDSIDIVLSNYCGPTIPNCATAVPNVSTDFKKPSYSCATCNPGYMQTIKLGGETAIQRRNIPIESYDSEYGTSPLTIVPGVQCVLIANDYSNVLGESKYLDGVSGCDYFQSVFPSLFGCNKCKWGQTGIVVDLIKNCSVFDSPVQCRSCVPNYYRKSARECMPVATILNCVTYDTTATSTLCSTCHADFYLTGNACVLRVNSYRTPNATAVVLSDDVTCATNFVKDSVVSPIVCRQYPYKCKTVTLSSPNVTCTSCVNGYYLNGSAECTTGSVANCATYQTSADTCVTCATGYYLSGLVCLQHTVTDSNCATWSGNIKNKCDACDAKSILMNVPSKCISVDQVIPNCTEYSDVYTCKKCAANYYLDFLSKACVQIPASSNCVEMMSIDFTSNGLNAQDLTNFSNYAITCNKCANKYYKKPTVVNYTVDGNPASASINTCYGLLDASRLYCNESDINGSTDFGAAHCTGCASGNFPYDFTNKFVCVEKQYVELFSGPADCEVYTYNGINLTCSRCKFGMFLSNTGTCVAICDPAASALLSYTFYFKLTGATPTFNKGYCFSNSEGITGEVNALYQSSVRISLPTTIESRISKCNDITKIPVVDFTATTYARLFVDPYGASHEMSSPFDAFEALKSCQSLTGKTVNGYVNKDKFISNCQYYYLIAPNTYGCLKCKFGYTGRIKSTINQGIGFIEYCSPMDSCDLTYKSGFFNTVAASVDNGVLERYFSCFRCSDPAKLVVAAVAASDLGNAATKTYVSIYGVKQFQKTRTTRATQFNIGVTDLAESLHNQCITETVLATTLDMDVALKVVNCGAYILNVDSDGAAANNGLMCVACLPGFAPTYNVTRAFQIDTCTAIANCPVGNLGKTFNKCDTCVASYNLYDDSVDYNTCLNVAAPVTTVSCHAASDGKTCQLCRKGYELNTSVANEAGCYQIAVPRCSSVNYYGDFSINYKPVTFVQDTAFYLYAASSYDNPITGCTACTNPTDVLVLNKTSVSTNIDSHMCIATPTDPRKPADIPNCIRHGWDEAANKYTCRECNGSNLLTEDKKCIATDATRLPLCAVAKTNSIDVCIKCINNAHVIVGGVCLDPTDPANSTLFIANCTAYDAGSASAARPICQTCAATFYLAGDGTCKTIPVANCKTYDDTFKCLVCNDFYAKFTIATGSVCIKLDTLSAGDYDSDASCLRMTINPPGNNVQDGYLNCAVCKPDNFLSVAAGDLVRKTKCVSVANALNSNCSAYDVQPTVLGSTFKCTACSNPALFYLNQFTNLCTSRTNLPNNCNAYDNAADVCTGCDDNYKLNFQGTACDSIVNDVSGVPLNQGYIHTCRPMDTCNIDWFYEGLSADLAAFYSCHVCKDPAQIPFIGVRMASDNLTIQGLNEFSFKPTLGTNFNTGVNGAAVQCLNPVKESFGISNASNFVFPPNCAAGMVKANYAADATGSSMAATTLATSSIICTACKPSFKAVGATIAGPGTAIKYMVSSCTAIANCQYSRWFNACTQCAPNFSLTYNLTTGINYDECVAYSENPLCYAVSVVAGVKTCKECKKGSYLNKDGICDLIVPPRCQVGAFKFDRYLVAQDLRYGLFQMDSGVGCEVCESGFVGIYAPRDSFVCTESLYLVNNTLGISTKYVQNCVNFTNTPLGDVICAVCAANFTLTVNGTCTPSAQVANCSLAFDGTRCKTCSGNNVLVNRSCVAPAIANCITYSTESHNFEQVCKVCGPGYFLNGNTCTQGKVANCKFMENATKCDICNDGYTNILADNNTSFCYPNSSKLNCAAFDPIAFQAGVLRCTTCVNNNYVISTSRTDSQATFCMPFTDMDKCTVFNNGLILSSSSFQCQKCADGYYLSNGTCNKRAVLPAQCTAYDLFNDKCTACAYGYYVDNAGASCVAYPEGIKNCISYVARSTCAACDTKMYLVDNACVAVTTEIPNCLYYHDATTCNICAANFVKVRGTCVASLAQNCLTNASLAQCKTCAAGYVLATVGALVNCVNQPVTSCATYDTEAPFGCVTCAADYYLSNSACVAVTTKVTNCAQYDSATTCAKCANRTALSVDKKTCSNDPDVVVQIDPNCTNPVLSSTPVCTICKAGYYFKYGQCTACSDQTLAKGCYTCSPDAPSVCLMCASGFYMTPEGDCISLTASSTAAGRIEAPVTISKIMADGHALTK